MDMLKIPTDNLYKFLAVTGLVLFLGCGYLAYLYQQNIDKELMLHEVKIKNLDASISRLSKEASFPTSSSEIVSLFDTINNSPEKAREIFKKKDQALQDLKDEELQKIFEDNLKPYIEREIKDVQKLTSALWFIAIAGGIVSIIGFLLWYLFVQRYMDIKLRHER